MKGFLLTILLGSCALAAPSPDKIIQGEALSHWLMDVGERGARSCPDQHKSHVRIAAEEKAVADCESQGFMLCLVRNSIVTVNGHISDAVAAKHGLSSPGFTFSRYGCEAKATVYGYR